MKPSEVVKAWVKAFNQANGEELARFYSDEAVNHQVAENPVVGRDAIKDMFASEFAKADMVCIVGNQKNDEVSAESYCSSSPTAKSQ